jgi:hypothetical protein
MNLEELERNWEIVKNSPLYDAQKSTSSRHGDYTSNKKHFDGLYNTYKLKHKNSIPNNNNNNREREELRN